MSENKETKQEQYERELEELREKYQERSVLNPNAAKKILPIAIVIFVILVIVMIVKGMNGTLSFL